MVPAMEYGYRLMVARKLARVRQTDLAEALGITRQTIIAWERSENLPDNKAMAYRDALSRLSETSSTPPTSASSSAAAGGASS
jgi:DNA-binding XRE family transcriptional regulator